MGFSILFISTQLSLLFVNIPYYNSVLYWFSILKFFNFVYSNCDQSEANSTQDFEETIDLNKAFETSCALDVGHHPFASMEENPDKNKAKVLQGISTKEQRHVEARRRWLGQIELCSRLIS